MNQTELAAASGKRAWQHWVGQSVNRRIFSAALTVGFFSVVVKAASVLKELLVARTFGTTDAIDAFLVALILPSFGINVIAGSFNTALIPTFVRTRDQEGRGAAQELLSSVVGASLLLLVGVCLLLCLCAGYVLPVFGSSFGPAKISLARSFFLILTPCLVTSGIATTWAAVLNACHSFAVPALTPGITPLVTVSLLLTSSKGWDGYSLAVGMLIGSVIEASVLAFGLRRQGFSIRPSWRFAHPALRHVIGQYLPMAAGAFLMSSTVVIDQTMAASLGAGSVAALNYGSKVVGLILSVGSLAIGTAVFPHFSEMIARNDWKAVRHTLLVYSKLIMVITVPVALGLALFSTPLIHMIFERGRFTAADTQIAGRVQAFYALQIPFYALGTLMVRLISAFSGNKYLMWGAMISLPLDVICNLIFMRAFGIAGIGLSTTTVYFVSFLYLAGVLGRRLRLSVQRHG